jgi:type II secretion system protein H
MLKPKMIRSRGFTLVEILCVVVILGIASAIIIPQLGSRDDLVVSSAARVLMADLIYAQNRAISTQRRQYVQFNGQTYTVLSREADADPLVAITHPVNKNTYSFTFGSTAPGMANVTLTSANFGGQAYMGFDELGSPFAYDSVANTITPLVAPGTVVLTAGGASLTISVEPYTGEITVQ